MSSVFLELWPTLSAASGEHHGVPCDSPTVIDHLAADAGASVAEVAQWKAGTRLPTRAVLERYAALYLFHRRSLEALVEAARNYVPGTTFPQDPAYYRAEDYAPLKGDSVVQAAGMFCENFGPVSGLTCLRFIKYLVTRHPRSIEEGVGMLMLAFPQYSGVSCRSGG